MEDTGVIEGYTAKLDEVKMGKPVQAFVMVFMKTTDHPAFGRFLAAKEMVREAHRVSGEGCYWLKVSASDHEELNRFLDELLKHGNYQLNLSIGRVK